MADLPETLTITVTIPPSNVSAGSTIEAISTIGMGVPGLTGPAPTITNGTIATGAPGSDVELTFTQTGEGVYRVDGSIPEGQPGLGTGDVVGPAGAVDSHVALFNGTTGKLVKDGGALGSAAFASTAAFATAAQGAKADTAVQPAGLTKAAVGLGNVDNTSDANKPVSTAQQTALNLKADLASPALTGTPTAPTAAGSTNTTQVATTAFVQGALPTKAAASDLRTGTDDAKYLTAKAVRDAMAFVALTDAATIAVDMATGFNFSVTLGGNRTLGAPTNSIAGQSGLILITQDGTGSRTLSYNTAWKFAGGTPTASTAAGTVDAIAYTVTTGGGTPIIRATYIKAFA